MLVIGPDGSSKGVMPTSQALTEAKRLGLDLVEISPTARPPVCKILDYGKYKYETSKRDKEAKKGNVTSNKVKELKFHINIDGHDYDTKMRHAEEFLMKGMKVKMMMVFRGREMQHKNIGHQLVKKIQEDLKEVGLADSVPKLVGRNINLMLTPLPAKKRVRKFTKEAEDSSEENSGNLEQSQEKS